MCISSNTFDKNYKVNLRGKNNMGCIRTEACNHTHCETCTQYEISNLTTKLEYTKTYEEEQEEQKLVATAEGWLENIGIKIKTDNYGYYRNTYDILKDLGEYLIENNIYKTETISRITTIEEDIFTPEQVRKMTQQEVRDNYKKIIESMKYWS